MFIAMFLPATIDAGKLQKTYSYAKSYSNYFYLLAQRYVSATLLFSLLIATLLLFFFQRFRVGGYVSFALLIIWGYIYFIDPVVTYWSEAGFKGLGIVFPVGFWLVSLLGLAFMTALFWYALRRAKS